MLHPRENPVTEAFGDGAEGSNAWGRFEKDTATLMRCTTCGAHWMRPVARPWASQCPTCYRWSRAHAGIQVAAQALRGVQP